MNEKWARRIGENLRKSLQRGKNVEKSDNRSEAKAGRVKAGGGIKKEKTQNDIQTSICVTENK